MPKMTVDKKTLEQLLNDGFKKIVPEYQRPYAWTTEECRQLWYDIITFFDETEDINEQYFLGSIVYYKTDNSQYHIIDGQQRITSFTLLLKVIYEKSILQKSHNIDGLITRLASCIWERDGVTYKIDFNAPFLESHVITEYDNNILKSILSQETVIDCDKKSKYYCNYLFFKNQIDDYAKKYPSDWFDLCVKILQRCIVMPIECDKQEDALRIFTTLNNRGMILTDVDIFKGEIYKAYSNNDDKKRFIEHWKQMDKELSESTLGDNGFQFLFTQEMHVIRAKEKNHGKEIGLRAFYTNKNVVKDSYDKKSGIYLHNKDLLTDLEKLKNFWLFDQYNLSKHTQQLLQILSFFPNEYWKIIVSTAIMHKTIYSLFCEETIKDKLNDSDSEFNLIMQEILRRSITMLFIKFIDYPSVNVVRDPIFKGYVNLYEHDILNFDTNISEILNSNNFENSFFNVFKMIKPLLALYSYIHFEDYELLPNDVQIEHIFPKKWQNTNYNGWNRDDAEEYLEDIGNKIFLERKLNIQAGNGYFGRKKDRYKESKLLQPQEIASKYKKNNDWIKDDIGNRNSEIYEEIFDFFDENLEPYKL